MKPNILMTSIGRVILLCENEPTLCNGRKIMINQYLTLHIKYTVFTVLPFPSSLLRLTKPSRKGFTSLSLDKRIGNGSEFQSMLSKILWFLHENCHSQKRMNTFLNIPFQTFFRPRKKGYVIRPPASIAKKEKKKGNRINVAENSYDFLYRGDNHVLLLSKLLIQK